MRLEELSTENKISKLKRRRDELLSRACNRQEYPALFEEVRAINRRIWELEGQRTDR